MNEEIKSEKPKRSGSCPFCMRKHLLKARGYARELAEDETREWEKSGLLENLLLAEDHADALGDGDMRERIHSVRVDVENGRGGTPGTSMLYDWFVAKYFPAKQAHERDVGDTKTIVNEVHHEEQQ